METLKVEIPKGYEFESFDKQSSEIKLKQKPDDITSKIESIADVLAELGDDDEEVIIYKKLITLFDAECHTVNYQLAVLIAKALNQKWVPNWDNSSEYKYYPWFDMRGGSSGFRCNVCAYWGSLSTVGSRLCFKSSKLAEYAGNQFINVYKKFML